MWEILNSNRRRWGTETYPTKEDAEKELRDFWRGVSGVDLAKFSIEETPIIQDQEDAQQTLRS